MTIKNNPEKMVELANLLKSEIKQYEQAIEAIRLQSKDISKAWDGAAQNEYNKKTEKILTAISTLEKDMNDIVSDLMVMAGIYSFNEKVVTQFIEGLPTEGVFK